MPVCFRAATAPVDNHVEYIGVPAFLSGNCTFQCTCQITRLADALTINAISARNTDVIDLRIVQADANVLARRAGY